MLHLKLLNIYIPSMYILFSPNDSTHSEIIMIIGYSKLLLHFLKEAARFRKFQLILAENAPLYDKYLK